MLKEVIKKIFKPRAIKKLKSLMFFPLGSFVFPAIIYFYRKRNKNEKLIVFLTDRPSFREVKLAYGLENIGYKVVIVAPAGLPFDESVFYKVERYSNIAAGIIKVVKYPAYIYHFFSHMNYDIQAYLIKHKPGKIVFDDYDILRDYYHECFVDHDIQIKKEKYCLENADGLCCRSLETQHLKKTYSYRFGPRIFFPEYCMCTHKTKEVKKTGQVSIVFAGGFPRYLYEFAKICNEHDIILKIYSCNKLDDCLKDYKNIIQCGVITNYNEFIEAVSESDFGVQIPFSSETGALDYKNPDLKSKYSMANKIFDYLDAGLAVITSGAKLQAKILKNVNACILLDNSNVNEAFKKIIRDLKAGKFSKPEGIENFNINKQILRMESFYKKIFSIKL